MVSVTDAGRCVFRLYMPHASSVDLLGTFCDWMPEQADGAIELEREDDGWWSARVRLPEGDHEFCYLVNGHTWMPDYAASGIRRHSTGRWVSLVSVTATIEQPRDDESRRPIGALAEPRSLRSGAALSTSEELRVFAGA